MSERELTREQLLTLFGVEHDTRLSEWPFEIPSEMVRRIIDTDAALRAERDKYKIDSAAWEEQVDELVIERDAYKRKYDLVLNNAAYGECCEIRAEIAAERDALKVQYNELRESFGAGLVRHDVAIDIGKHMAEHFADLTRRLEKSKQAYLELASLFPVPSNAKWHEAVKITRNNNPADVECILKAHDLLREAVWKEPS